MKPGRIIGALLLGGMITLTTATYAIARERSAVVLEEEGKYAHPGVAAPQETDTNPNPRVRLRDSEWKKRLSSFAYYVTRKAGTEAPFSHPYHNLHEEGVFRCIGCGLELFASNTKFDSGTGWPSFYQPLARNRVSERPDYSMGVTRTEVLCARCGGHLGHVFDDGPRPTGLRYCMNGASLTFRSAKDAKEKEKAAEKPAAGAEQPSSTPAPSAH